MCISSLSRSHNKVCVAFVRFFIIRPATTGFCWYIYKLCYYRLLLRHNETSEKITSNSNCTLTNFLMPISSWLESLVSPTVCPPPRPPPLVAVGVPAVGKYAGHVTLVDLLTRARLRSDVSDSF